MQFTKKQVLVLLFAEASAQRANGEAEYALSYTISGQSPTLGYAYFTFADGAITGRACDQDPNLVCPPEGGFTEEACKAITGTYSADGTPLPIPEGQAENYPGDHSTSNIYFTDETTFYGGVLGTTEGGDFSFTGLIKASDTGTFTFSEPDCPFDVTVAEIINGTASTDTVIEGMAVTAASSLQVCSTDQACTTTATDECAAFQEVGTTLEDTVSYCVHADVCGTVGKRNGNAFSVQCWGAEAVATPALVEIDTLLTSVETIVNGKDDATSWADFRNLKVPSRDNYQTGWWTRESDNSEANSACADDECCVYWPDANNKRCKAKTVAGVPQTILPFAVFTPTCAANANAPPQSAEVDLGEQAEAEAAEALEEFRATIETGAKTAAGYAEMSEEEKAAFDDERAKRTAIYNDLEAKLKLEAGFDGDECDEDCKVVWRDEFLKWDKEVYEQCKADARSIDCRDFVKIKEAEESARATAGFYSKTPEERDAYEAGREQARAATKAALTAAYIEDNAPAAGEEGSSCGTGPNKCETETHCCGTATPKGNAAGVTTNEIENICATESIGVYVDTLGREYTHSCGAKALLASATAVLAAVFLM